MRDSKAAKFLSHEMMLSDYSQKDLADLCGFKTANIITMLKQGLTKIPIDKIPILAKALNVDPVKFYKIVMIEYRPKEYQAIIEIIGEPITASERGVVALVRELMPYSEMESNLSYLKKIKDIITNDVEDRGITMTQSQQDTLQLVEKLMPYSDSEIIGDYLKRLEAKLTEKTDVELTK